MARPTTMAEKRLAHGTAAKSADELADMLTMGHDAMDDRPRTAEAELRLREHNAIIEQAEAAGRSAAAAERSAAASERAAVATKHAASATIEYAKYTQGILWASIVAAAAAISALMLHALGYLK